MGHAAKANTHRQNVTEYRCTPIKRSLGITTGLGTFQTVGTGPVERYKTNLLRNESFLVHAIDSLHRGVSVLTEETSTRNVIVSTKSEYLLRIRSW